LNKTIEMFRDSAERGGRDLFTCSVAEWVLFQKLGRDFGWAPLGTTYIARNVVETSTPAFHGYTPGDTADLKIVAAGDARNWARALEDRRRALRAEPAEAGQNVQLSGLIDDFIEYAYGGEFKFALASS